MISKETQRKITEITPKLKLVNCIGAICRASGTHPYFETMRQTINIMNVDEQAELAERWENRFTSSLQFITYLTTDKKELAFWKEKGVIYEN